MNNAQFEDSEPIRLLEALSSLCVYTNSIYFPTIFSYYRGLPELKEKVANCVGLIGGNLGNEAGR